MALNSVAYPRTLSLPILIVGVGYLAGYVLLDWISFIEPYSPLNITPSKSWHGIELCSGNPFRPTDDSLSYYWTATRGSPAEFIASNLGGRAVVRCPDWQWVFRRFGILVAPKHAV